MIYNIFGSRDSRDCDIMVFVNTIGSVAESKRVVEECVNALQPLYAKKVNVNLAIIIGGYVAEVFKGTPDEVNNSVYYTYRYHEQAHPLKITGPVVRDPGIKALRSMRAILSFISRTSYREEVKVALNGTASDKHAFLSKLSFKTIVDLGHKNTDLIDFYKMVAFQIGQSYLLNVNTEVYTKYDIGATLPDLKPFLMRTGSGDVNDLDQIKDLWLGSFNPKLIPEYEALRK